MAGYSLEELRFNDLSLKAQGRINFTNSKGAIQKGATGGFGGAFGNPAPAPATSMFGNPSAPSGGGLFAGSTTSFGTGGGSSLFGAGKTVPSVSGFGAP